VMQITERCEELDKIKKVVNYQLSFNVQKHAEEFGKVKPVISEIVEGMDKIKQI